MYNFFILVWIWWSNLIEIINLAFYYYLVNDLTSKGMIFFLVEFVSNNDTSCNRLPHHLTSNIAGGQKISLSTANLGRLPNDLDTIRLKTTLIPVNSGNLKHELPHWLRLVFITPPLLYIVCIYNYMKLDGMLNISKKISHMARLITAYVADKFGKTVFIKKLVILECLLKKINNTEPTPKFFKPINKELNTSNWFQSSF